MERLHELTALNDIIAQLLRRGFSDGSLKIKYPESEQYLLIRKYLYPLKNYGIKVCLPCKAWSAPYFPTIKSYCENKGIEFFEEKAISPEQEEELCIDCNKDVAKAYSLVKVILTEIFSIPQQKQFVTRLENCSPWDELIDSPHQRPLPFTEGMKQSFSELRERTNLSLHSIFLFLLLGVTQILGALGAAYSLLFADESWRWTQIEVLNTRIEAPFIGLVFGILILVGSLRLLTNTYWRVRSAREAQKNTNNRSTPTRTSLRRYMFPDPVSLVSFVVFCVAGFAWVTV